MNVGREAGADPGALIRFVSRGIRISGSEVGRIDIRPEFSFFEVPEQYTDKILSLNDKDFGNKTVSIEVAKGSRESSRRGGGGRRDGSYKKRSSSPSNGGRSRRQRHPKYTTN